MFSIMKILQFILNVFLLPFYLIFIFVVLLLWGLWTISGIGPIFQYFCNKLDRHLLNVSDISQNDSDFHIITVPKDINYASNGQAYKIFAIYSEPKEKSNYPPVCIPNGLGATAVLISQMQEKLVELGFTVLSYDRYGVGFSDANVSGKSPTAVDIVKEMDFVMDHFHPSHAKWILLGPSMGSIIAQCYISSYPEKVAGFLNMDGLPYPFIQFHNSFMWAAFIYRVYASIIWTGILRPFIGMALKSNEDMFKCKKFPLDVAIAQMNQSRFFANVGLEMWTMMDCCEMAEIAWGSLSLLQIPESHLKTLVCAPPTLSIDFNEKTNERNVTLERSPSEVGKSWANPEDVAKTAAFLKSAEDGTTENPLSSSNNNGMKNVSLDDVVSEHRRISNADPLLKFDALEQLTKSRKSFMVTRSRLGEIWSNLIVRVMSGRNYDFGNAAANAFYTQTMRDYAAAEHAKHAMIALDGARTVYPKLTHTVMFSKTDDIVRNIQEIAFAYNALRPPVAKSESSEPPSPLAVRRGEELTY